MQDWRSAQTTAFNNAGVTFNIDAGYNIDGYVLHGVAKVQADTAAGGLLMLCI